MRVKARRSGEWSAEAVDVSMAPRRRGPAAIVTALSWEAAPVSRHLGLRRRRTASGVAQYADAEDRVVLLQGGIGAGGAARAVARLDHPALILSVGFCGGLGRVLAVGDLVVASCVVRGSMSYPADPFLLERATRAIKHTGFPCHVGTLQTVDEVIVLRAEGSGQTEASPLAVDMESAHLAEAAQQAAIPFLGIRVVSDTPGEPWAAYGSRFLHADGRLNLVTLGAALLRQPSWSLRLVHLAVTLRRAARQLARAIEAVLKEVQK
jgi:adenosylhomocysteine nucleosidase